MPKVARRDGRERQLGFRGVKPYAFPEVKPDPKQKGIGEPPPGAEPRPVTAKCDCGQATLRSPDYRRESAA